jgi:hypothetical protein
MNGRRGLGMKRSEEEMVQTGADEGKIGAVERSVVAAREGMPVQLESLALSGGALRGRQTVPSAEKMLGRM